MVPGIVRPDTLDLPTMFLMKILGQTRGVDFIATFIERQVNLYYMFRER